MKSKFTIQLISNIIILTFLSFSLHAQTIILSEDFASGIPGSWSQSPSPSGSLWEYRGPSSSPDNTVGSRGAYATANDPIQSSTTTNGFIIFDSDFYDTNGIPGNFGNGSVPAPHTGELILPVINCSSNSTVKIQFTQYYRNYSSVTKIAVSNDGSSYTDFIVNDLIGLNKNTANNDKVTIDISAVAANQSSVYVKFIYDGTQDLFSTGFSGYYFWQIDDIKIYEPAAQDAGVSAFIAPYKYFCSDNSANETFTVTIQNYGTSSMSNFDISYVVDLNSPVTETITNTIFPGGSLEYSFTQTADLSSLDSAMVTVYTSLTGDGDYINDTIQKLFYKNTVHDLTASTLNMSFEPNESFAPWKVFDADKDIKTWELFRNSDYTRTGEWALLLNYDDVNPKDDWFFTPCMYLEQGKSYRLVFYYIVGGTATNPPRSFMVMAGTENSPAAMTQTIVDLPAIGPNLSYPQVVGNISVSSTGSYYLGFYDYSDIGAAYMMIDDILVYEVSPTDAGVVNILSPFQGNCLQSATDTIIASIKNFGTSPISNIPISYQINTGTPINETISSTIQPDSTLDYTFSSIPDLSSPNSYNILIYTSISGDGGSWNDSIMTTVKSISNDVDAGFNMGFELSEGFAGWSIDDANSDGSRWYRATNDASLAHTDVGYIWYDSSMINVADDWFMSPCLSLTAGQNYDLTFFYRTDTVGGIGNYLQDFEVLLGAGQTVAEMNAGQVLTSQTGAFSNPGYMQLTAPNFSVTTTGVYYLGFHVTSQPSQNWLLIDDINIQKSIGIKNHDLANDFISIAPNPSNGKFIIRNTLQKNNLLNVEVRNLLGQTVTQSNFNKFNQSTIDLSSQPDGVYFVKIKTAEGMITKKIVLSR